MKTIIVLFNILALSALNCCAQTSLAAPSRVNHTIQSNSTRNNSSSQTFLTVPTAQTSSTAIGTPINSLPISSNRPVASIDTISAPPIPNENNTNVSQSVNNFSTRTSIVLGITLGSITLVFLLLGGAFLFLLLKRRRRAKEYAIKRARELDYDGSLPWSQASMSTNSRSDLTRSSNNHDPLDHLDAASQNEKYTKISLIDPSHPSFVYAIRQAEAISSDPTSPI
ncbi:hypothetical protein J3Q64DRAFT_1818769 [Phycomyces blakesleeanus]|uniref:Mid2 domain-containing protein n=2 Tax=Phycomyces blakesleeanus TaxID=4837 RepID=A0A162N957_PHYB8|nr:hypothetical protein PHYBLDRAFT_70359 [Phycomyces blakesleeanus NRRL 1555(-)]OAD67004.1 hypothetical protein PHYBLDRAFT_70359 [Phycomyces blakesleeanus NRRL 1555(-)]|eukprot:XP_018285044.1 hypothetical protein PHYBLDRAFT_70359 [Phycomyces blakesleeanus NRRL 1555(-)]